jgi:hypothetical protein
VTGTPQRGAVLTKASGYNRAELVQIIEQLP